MVLQSNLKQAKLSRLEVLVHSLHLSEGRINAPGSASVMTLRTVQNAGFLLVDDIHLPKSRRQALGKSQASKVLTASASRCSDILENLQDLLSEYFVDLSKKAVTIPTDVMKDTIDLSQIKCPADYVNALTSLAVAFVSNNLGTASGAKNPFVFQSATELTEASAEQMDTAYPGMRISMLPEDKKHDASDEELKHALSWFNALDLTAEPNGEGKDSEMTVQHIIGGSLHRLTSLPFCHVLSDRKLQYPDILKLSIHVTKSEVNTNTNAGKAVNDNQTAVRKVADTQTGSNEDSNLNPQARRSKKGKDVVPKEGARKRGPIARKTAANVSSDDSQRKNAAKEEDLADTSSGKKGQDTTKSSVNETKKVIGNCHPDFATRPRLPPLSASERKRKHSVEQLLQPVIILGEVKRDATGAGKEPTEDKKYYTVQLAVAAHPSLVLFILLHTQGQEFDESKHTAPLPRDFFIYTIYFDETRLIISAQFPYYFESTESDEKSGWRFVQAKIKEFPLATFNDITGQKSSAQLRVEFAIAIHAVREHGKRLHALFTSDKYRDLVDLITEDLE